jgi:REP element-mobilizing transposase RayT
LFGDIVGIDMQLNRFGEIVDECWLAIPDHFGNVELDVFVVMPNHVHGIIVITEVGATHASPLRIPNGPNPRSIGAVRGSFKSGASRRINEIRATPGQTCWQRNYYEHVIRDDAELDRIREYIKMNPAHWAEDRENPNGNTKQ